MNIAPLKIYPGVSVDALYSVILADFDTDFRFPGETHDIWELTCVLRGRIGITSGEKIYTCDPYDVFIHPPGMFHTCWADDEAGYSSLTLAFTGQGLDYFLPFGKFILQEEEKFFIHWMVKEIPQMFIGTDDYRLHTPILCENLPKEKIPRLKNILELLILSLSSHRTEAAQPVDNRNALQFSAISRYMYDHVCDALNTEDLCMTFGISRSTLKDIFHRFTGGGVMEYYHYLRIHHAISMMAAGMSMAEISIVMNFSSQNYFSSFFKRETGLSPVEYRKQKLQGK